MQISLITHGTVNMPLHSMNATAFYVWMEQYKEADIVPITTFPIKTVEAVRFAKRIVVSDAVCAVQSAAALLPSLSFVQNALFHETPIPKHLPVPGWLQLKPSSWIRLGRTLWLIGYSVGVESYGQAIERAKQAVDLLTGYAFCDQNVALIGHAFFNSMIAKELQRRGWLGPLWSDSRNWSCTTYRYHKVFVGKELHHNVRFTAT